VNIDGASVLQVIDETYKAMGRGRGARNYWPSERLYCAWSTSGVQKLATDKPFSAGTQKRVATYVEVAGRHRRGLTVDKPRQSTALMVTSREPATLLLLQKKKAHFVPGHEHNLENFNLLSR
jgi:hypothetical protein